MLTIIYANQLNQYMMFACKTWATEKNRHLRIFEVSHSFIPWTFNGMPTYCELRPFKRLSIALKPYNLTHMCMINVSLMKGFSNHWIQFDSCQAAIFCTFAFHVEISSQMSGLKMVNWIIPQWHSTPKCTFYFIEFYKDFFLWNIYMYFYKKIIEIWNVNWTAVIDFMEFYRYFNWNLSTFPEIANKHIFSGVVFSFSQCNKTD